MRSLGHQVGGLRSGLRVLLFVLCPLLLRPAWSADTDLNHGYREMYNLDFVAAHETFHNFMKESPLDPLGPVSDAAAYLFAEFDRLGVLDIELFADDERFLHRNRPVTDQAARSLFYARTREAEVLVDRALAKNPKDAHAFYARTLIYGLRSDYSGMIDRSNLTALKWTKLASKSADEALRLQPDLYDAHLATGVENYMLSLKPAPVRWLINLSGGQSDKQRGIEELRITAEHGCLLAPLARLMLAVAELREGHRQAAKKLLGGLSQEFPGNTLYSRQMRRISE